MSQYFSLSHVLAPAFISLPFSQFLSAYFFIPLPRFIFLMLELVSLSSSLLMLLDLMLRFVLVPDKDFFFLKPFECVFPYLSLVFFYFHNHACLTALCCVFILLCYQAWLTEIHEYAQQDVVLMLLGNKASNYVKYLEATRTLNINKTLALMILISYP